MKKEIEKEFKGTNDDYDLNVIFLTSEYNKAQETFNAVDEIARKKCQSDRVLICTSVMKNGVSIKDNTVKIL